MRFLKIALFTVAIILLILAAGRTAFFEAVERVTEDFRFRVRRSHALDPRISLVLVDPATMDKYNYPVPRRYYAVVVKKLCENGASAVAIDRTFEARDPVDIVGGAMLTETLKHHNNVILAWYSPVQNSIKSTDRPVVPVRFSLPHKLSEIGISPHNTSLYREKISLPYYEALQSAGWLGSIMAGPEQSSGNIVKVPLVVKHGDRIYPAISLASVCVALNVNMSDVSIKREGIFIPTKDGVIAVPTDEKGQIRVNYLRYGSTFLKSKHSLSTVYESVLSDYPVLPLESFRDGIVLIGNEDIMGADTYYTPYGERVPGVAIHAMVIDSILQQRFIGAASWYWNLIIIAVSVFGVLYIQSQFSPRIGFTLAFVPLICIWAGAVALFQFRNTLINVSQPTSGVILAFACATSYNYIAERRRVKHIRQVFGKHVSQEVMDQLVLEPGGQIPMAEQEVSALFSDICDHSIWASKLQPEIFARELNECLKAMSEAAFENGGTINAFLGDGLLVIYNAPVQQEDHALRAVKTGIAIQEHISKLNENRAQRGEQPISIRVGINTGRAMAGTLGSEDRLDYTVIGDTINMAKRTEGECEPGRVAVTEDVVNKLGEMIQVESIGVRPVKGRDTGLVLYHVAKVVEEEDQ